LPKLIAIVGPTASGKTDVAVAVAQRFDGEIVLADSRQLYRGVDIAANKAAGEWRTEEGERRFLLEGIPYHGMDVAEPNEVFTASAWKQWAEGTIAGILQRGHMPVVEGGTGLYVSALLENWQFPVATPHPALRAQIEARIRREGVDVVAQEILERDPDAAAFLDTQNPRRVARALEVLEATGLPFSAQRTKGEPKYDTLLLGITRSLEDIDARIAKRAAEQFTMGLEDEARTMLARYGTEPPAMTSIGYLEWQDFFDGTITREEVLARNIKRNRDLARAQLKWWKKNPTIRWVSSAAEAVSVAETFLRPMRP
jgi:tRNA dimethylallyltransferase